jgi:hypothetical protein
LVYLSGNGYLATQYLITPKGSLFDFYRTQSKLADRAKEYPVIGHHALIEIEASQTTQAITCAASYENLFDQNGESSGRLEVDGHFRGYR